MVDDDIENAGIYKPDHYVIISHSINHYMLIKYNNKGIFTFETLPPSIKNIIIPTFIKIASPMEKIAIQKISLDDFNRVLINNINIIMSFNKK